MASFCCPLPPPKILLKTALHQILVCKTFSKVNKTQDTLAKHKKRELKTLSRQFIYIPHVDLKNSILAINQCIEEMKPDFYNLQIFEGMLKS